MHRRLVMVLRFVLLIVIVSGLAYQPQSSALAASNLVVSPLTWNIIGLDSNSPLDGPYRFPVAVRACNPGSNSVTMTDVEADFVWLSGGTTNDDSVIRLRSGSLDPIAPSPQINLAPGNCYDFYFEVEVNQFAASPYDQTRRYRIDINYDDPEIAGGQTVSSTTPRELYVEHLISQSRNAITDVLLDDVSIPASGSMNLLVGNTYTITLEGGTATQGYNQFEAFINFPNTIFQILSVNTDYSANNSPYVSTNDHDRLYADACRWENDPNNPNYRSCIGGDFKSGGSNVVTTYVIKIIGGGGTQQTLNTLLYDFSGSSYHYNADYSLGVRFANIIDPTNVTIAKSFSPNPTNVNGVSALTITLTNPNAGAISGYNFTDPLPSNLVVANPPNASTTSCGTPTFAPTAGAASISFSNGTIAGNGSCTINVNVTPSTTGSFVNTTDHLFVDLIDTGKFATSTLTVNTAPPLPTLPSSCTIPVQLARWEMNTSQGTGVPPAESYTAPDVDAAQTAASFVSATGIASTISLTGSPTANSWAGTTSTGWAETPTSMNNYFQFVVDTDNYGGAYVVFDAGLFNNGDWANPTSNVYVNTSANTGGFTSYEVSPGVYLQASKNDPWRSGLKAIAASTGSDYTTFRIGVDGASKTSAQFRLDDVYFYGCERLDPPTIVKGFSPNPIAEGGTSTLTFRLSNPNPDALTGVAFTDTLPMGVTLASTPTTTCGGSVTGAAGGSTIDLSGGNLTGTFANLTGTIAVTNGSATVTGTGTSFLTQLVAGRRLFINQTMYTISAIASDTSLTLSTTYTGTTASGLTVPGELVGLGTCTVTATVTSNTAGAYQNVSGFVSSTNGGTNTGSSGSASASLTVIKPPSIDKAFSPNPILTGGTSTLTFTITNPNPSDALTGVSFKDTFPILPGAMTVASPLATTLTGCGAGSLLDNAGGTLASGDPGVQLTGATIAAGSTCTVAVDVTVPSTPASGVYTNTSEAVTSTNGGTGNTATDVLTVKSPVPLIGLNKQISTDNTNWFKSVGVAVPQNIWYKITISNDGEATLNGINVTDAPFDLTGCLPALPATLAVGASASCVLATSANSTPDPNPYINTATVTTTTYDTSASPVTSSAQYGTKSIELIKTALDATFNAVNDTLDYSYTVTNNGGYPLLGPVTVSDDRIMAPNTVTCPAVSTVGDSDNWLDPGESIVCTATYTVSASDISVGSVTNTASAAIDSVTSNPDTETVYGGAANLSITKNDAVASVNAGGTTSYTIRVTNNGPDGSTGAVFSDPAAAGLTKTAVACSATPGQCTVSTTPSIAQLESGTFALPVLASGQFYEITVTTTVSATSGTVTNTATVAPPPGGTDPDLTNNTAIDTDTITPDSDLTVSKTNNATNGWITSGGGFQWTLTVRNGVTSGTASFANGDVILSDVLPAGQTYGAVSVTNGTPAPTGTINCSITGTTLSCAANGAVTLPADASFSVAFNVTTSGTANLLNTATVDPGNRVPESNEGNNTGSDTVTVFNSAPSKVIVDTSEDSTTIGVDGYERAAIGEIVRYRVSMMVPEGGPFTNLQLLDNIPTGFQFLNDGTARVAFVSTTGGTVTSAASGSIPAITSALTNCGGLNVVGNSNAVTPTCPLPDLNVSRLPVSNDDVYDTGVDVYFKFGNITNTDNDADNEYIVVEFNALALNVNSGVTINQAFDNVTGAAGANSNRDNNATQRVNGSTIGSNSADARVIIAEPAITNVTKSVSAGPYAPGDTVTYTLTFSNVASANANAATAFDIVLTDALDANLTPGTINVSSTQTDPCIGGTAFTTDDGSSGQNVTIGISCLDSGRSVTVTVEATIDPATADGTNISNTGNVTYTSLPSAQGNCGVAPFTCGGVGGSGSAAGERNGSGGAGADASVLNNYADSGTVSFAVTAVSLPVATITVSPTSVAENGATNLVYTVTLDQAPTVDTVINLTTSGTAGGTDYTGSVPSVTILAGTTSATVTIDPSADTTVEPDETVILTIDPGVGYSVGTPSSATGTITNDDIPVATIAVSPASVTEDGATNLVYTVTLDQAPLVDTTVNLTTTGTALGGDYTGSVPSVTILAGTTTATITIDPTTDTTVEPDETVIITIDAGAGYTVGAPSSATGTITNDDIPVATITVNPASVVEDGATNLVYTVTLDKAPLVDTTINLTTTGTASGSDYSGSAASVTILAGTTSGTVTIDPTTDAIVEPNETVIITLDPGTGYTVGVPSRATGTITDDDLPVAAIAVSPVSVAEDGATNLVYTVTLDNAPLVDTVINLTTTGTATSGGDYSGSVTSVTILAGNTTATVTIDPVIDATIEQDETVIIAIDPGTGYAVGIPSSATGTITNDDIPVATISVNPASVPEDGTTNLVYTVTLDQAPLVDTTINLTTTGTASGSDYGGSVATVTILAGNTTATVTIDPNLDTAVEPDETVIITIDPGTGYIVGAPSSAIGTITNDDLPVATIAVNPASVNEDGATDLVYTVTLDQVALVDTAINLSTTGTATSGDFTGSAASVTILAGNTTATVTVDPTADTLVEPDETVIIAIDPGPGYSVGTPSSATGTITNDDIPVATITVNPVSVAEDGATNLVYTVALDKAPLVDTTINLSTTGTASTGDYTGSLSSVTILAGNTSATLTIDPTADAIVEPDETVTITIDPGAGYAVGIPTNATGTITDDDIPVATIGVSPVSVAEDGATNLVYTITLDKAPLVDTTVNLTTTGTALGTDYTGSVTSVTILAGTTSATVTIDPTTDTTAEPDETVIIAIASGTGYSVGTPSIATGTITDDDLPVATITVSPASVTEDGGTNLVYTVELDQAPLVDTVINLTTGGTAGGTDYTGSVSTVTILANTTTATVTIIPTDDSVLESNETVVVSIDAGTGYSVGTPSSATGTITDNDSPVATITVSPASVAEDSGTGLVYTVELDQAPLVDTVINLTTSGTAGGTDYTGSVATVTILAGTTSETVTIIPVIDAAVEPDETVILTITSGTDYTVGTPSSATGTIIDSNHAPIATDNEGSVDAATPTHTNNMVTGNEGHGVDSDPDSDPLTVTQLGTETNPANDVAGTYGSINWAANGSYTYTLNTSDPDYLALAAGAIVTDIFPYIISDGSGTAAANVIITITKLVGPDAIDDTDTTAPGTPVTTNVLTNDNLGTTPTTITSFTQPAHGTVTCSANNCIYTPSTGFSGLDTYTYTITDDSGLTDTATVRITVGNIFDPPFGLKTFNAAGLPVLRWTMVWINNSNTTAINVQVTDPISAGTTYAGNLVCTPTGVSTTALCQYDAGTNQVIWRGNLGPDDGATNAGNANNEVLISFDVTVASGITSVQNVATSDYDGNGDGDLLDTPEQGVFTVTSTWSATQPAASGKKLALPATGFAPNVITDLSGVPYQAYSATGDVTLEIQSLGLKLPVVGVPKKDGTWNVSWLGNQAGWLEGTAFPSWSGNSVLTSHVYLSNGLPGPFVNLGKLKYGDKVVIHAYGQKYSFEVRENKVVEPDDTSVMKHEEKSWLTLITCKEYDPITNTYRKRVVVRAVLVSVAWE